MKKNCVLVLCVVFLFSFYNSSAQCGTCTTTITGADAASHTILPGQTFCIAPGGSCSGLIIVIGGTLCNQGTINSTNVWIANTGSTLENYGTINTTNVLVSNGALFNNHSNAAIDSLWITNNNSQFHNFSAASLTNQAFSVSDSASGNNNGTIVADFMGDSIGTFINSGNLIINFDFGNGYSSIFQNTGYMSIGRDFYNSTLADFNTSCMINVGRHWYNAASISVPTIINCAGFNVAMDTYNSGTIGNASQHVDICDAQHPVGGIDGNIGTIANTTTYCACTNTCAMIVTDVPENITTNDLIITSVYPNPTVNNLNINFINNKSEQLTIEVLDLLGRTQIAFSNNITIGENTITIDISTLSQGIYILKTGDKKQLFTVAK